MTGHTLRHHNLPASTTRFIGRKAELEDLLECLANSRLVTVTGSAGCGKTRLALEAAAHLLPHYPDGVWLAELGYLSDSAYVGQAVATVLGVREEPGTPIAESLVAHLRGASALIVLDGCEHLVDATARLVDSLLRGCPSLVLVATSREALRVGGETTWRIPSLTVPTEAVALFIDRARLADPNFQPVGEDRASIEVLCQRLDGIPLAIELAAARMRAMSIAEILNRLEDRFRLLTGGSRTAMPRQQTLRAAVDWSYQHLEPAESLLFRRLSVFSGGLALDNLEAVCCDDRIQVAEAVDLLVRLVDKSLVSPEPRRSGRQRYRLLETLSEYGRERLAESGEASDLWRRHAYHFLQIAETEAPERIAEESDNLAAALEYLRSAGDETALRMGVALVGYWDSSGRVNEGTERLQTLLEAVRGDVGLRARALDGAGWLYLRQADMPRAQSLFREARDLLAASGDSEELARTMSNLGLATAFVGQFDEARTLLEQSLEMGRRAGATNAVAGSLWVLGLVAFFAGDLDEAERRATESLSLATEAGDHKLAGFTEAGLGIIKLQRKQLGEARRHLLSGLDLSSTFGDRLNVALVLEALCCVAVEESAWGTALKLAGAAGTIRDSAGAGSIPIWQSRVDSACEEARRALGSVAAVAAGESGRSLKFSDAVGLAREWALGPPRAGSTETQGLALTRREFEIAAMVAQGMTNRQIAELLVIAVRTVEGHVENIRGKLGFHSRTQIAAWATERELILRAPGRG